MAIDQPKVQCTAEFPCTAVQLLAKQTSENTADIKEMKEDIKSIRDRLPPWVMGAAWVVGIVIGVLGTLVAKGGS
jgi:hypothetical protein